MARTTPTVARNAVSSHLQVLVWPGTASPLSSWHLARVTAAARCQTPNPKPPAPKSCELQGPVRVSTCLRLVTAGQTMGCTKPSLQQDFFKPRKVVTKILYGSCPANLTVTRRRKWQSTHLPAHARAVGKILKAHKSHTHTQTMTVALHRHPACTGVGLVPDFCQTFLCKTQFFGHLAVREPATRICSVTRLPVSLRRKTRLGLTLLASSAFCQPIGASSRNSLFDFQWLH